MKTYKWFILFLSLTSLNVNAQQLIKLSFENDSQTVKRKNNAVSYPITIVAEISDSIKIDSAELNLYTVSATVNSTKTNLPSSAYKLNFNSVTLDKLLEKYTFFLTIEGDTIADRERKVHFDLELKKNGKTVDQKFLGENSSHVVLVEGVKLENYNYLGYVGTNFDLIDGVRAKDIFFAINILSPLKEEKKGLGFNIALYGNRTLSSIDTSGTVNYISGYEPVGGDSVAYYSSQAQKTIISVSDNLGAMFTPLFRLRSLSNSDRQTQLYYAPQFEFIWRRKLVTTSYINSVATDTTYRTNRPLVSRRFFPEVEKTPLNVYDIYLGLAGLSLVHENENISVRIHGSFGLNFSYRPERPETSPSGVESSVNTPYIKEENWFSYVRTYITEPTSGITFGAEVSNFIFKTGRYNPYYNVTLSKAIPLNALGTIFQPLTSR